MRLGVLGGTFNPIHNAHVQMASCAKTTMNLDRVLMMVAADPPHKRVSGLVSAEHRYHMVELAVAGMDGIEACDLELKRPGKSYTIDTLLELKEIDPDAELVMIIGSDTMQDFLSWHRPRDIIDLSEIACVPRKGLSSADKVAAATLRKDFGARLTMLPAAAEVISSTDVRNRVECAQPISNIVAKDVEWFIYENGLYFPSELKWIQDDLRRSLPEKRFQHTVGVMIEAVRLAHLWNADPKKARLAALLHDCAKYMNQRELTLLSGDDSGISAVQHAFAGAVVARTEFGVADEDVLRAIRLHCTGDYGMTILDKIIYLADITEQTRDFDGVQHYRKVLKKGADEAMIYALSQTKKRLEADGAGIHPATKRALTYYQNLKEVQS